MKANFETPEKQLEDLLKETPQTVQRANSEQIFSSEHKQSLSRISQRRYTNIRQSQIIDDEILPADIINDPDPIKEVPMDLKSGKLLNYTIETSPQPPPNYTRKHSHKRSSSICVPMDVSNEQIFSEISQQVKYAEKQVNDENKFLVKNLSPLSTGSHHGRNLSDCDSVIYLGHGEETTNEKDRTFVDSLEQTGELKNNFHKKVPTATTTCTTRTHTDTDKCESIELEVGKFQYETSVRGSLPVFGNMPCTAYCHFCKEVVHTSLDFSAKIPRPFIKVFSTIASCCRAPEWISKLRIHRCPKCSLVLAKSR
ncbi:unnamed protein product [Blepharisma stoltei]|uniref:LITAF domain-containing protein n=1 Tax=Blepharisma stoltei TaxID=1481888 RepID=A0AAU9JDT4_9CILI|nr:unnamed protein product [Blepharisma stoltei]